MSHRALGKQFENPHCPDPEAHAQNAADRLYPGKTVLGPEESAKVDAEADVEYRNCEGH